MFEKIIEHVTEAALPSHICYNLLDNPLRAKFNKISEKWQKNGPWRIPSAAYTMEHKMAFLAMEHYLTGHYTLRGIFHDWEKPFLYMIPGLDEQQIQDIHRNSHPHHGHGEAQKKIIEHFFETYVDWSCAMITKPDKPLDAFETLLQLYPEDILVMLPICLVLEPDRVRTQIFFRSDRPLVKSEAYNRDVMAQVKKALTNIATGDYPRSMEDLAVLYRDYMRNGEINSFNPYAIFMLALYKQSKNLGKDVDFEKLHDRLEEIFRQFESVELFINSAPRPTKFDYREIKPNPFMKA